MAGGYNKLTAKDNPKPFTSTYQPKNKKRAKRSSFKALNAKLSEKGIAPVERPDFIKAIGLLMNSTRPELKKLYNDPKQPAWIRYIIGSWDNKRSRDRAIEYYTNWMFGSAVQQIDVKGTIESDVTISFKGLSKDIQKRRNNIQIDDAELDTPLLTSSETVDITKLMQRPQKEEKEAQEALNSLTDKETTTNLKEG